MKKIGVTDNDLICEPTYPLDDKTRVSLIKRNKPKSPIYHNCSGKHLVLIAMTKYYKCDSKRYWHIDTIVQKEIIQCISLISGCPTGKIKIGVDGCGVPVFALPLKFLAKSYMMLACPQFINDEGIRSSVREVSNLQSKITFRF